jgi:hypothetical protein
MSELARITAVVTANTTQFTRAMRAADAQTRTTATSMRQVGSGTRDVEKGMSRVGASSKVAAAGMKAAKYAMAGLAITAYVGFREMKDGEKVSAMTANTLRNVGNSAGFTVKKIESMSSALALQTGMADEVIQSSANLLLGFKDIGNNAQVFDKVLAVAMDRSAKTGRDLVTTTRAIGFAYQAPTSGVMMLRRAGVLLTKETQKQIKDLATAGKLEQARALLLDKVGSSAKGAAKELGKTSTGQVARLQESFNQMAESVFQSVLPALLEIGPALIDLAKSAAPAFAAIGKGIATVASPIAKMASAIAQSRVGVVALTAAFTAFIGLGVASKVAGMVGAIRGLAGASAAAGAASTALSTTGAMAGGAAGKVGLLARAMPLMLNPLTAVTVGVGLGIAALYAFRNEMSAGQRMMQGLTQRTGEYRAQVVSANAAISGQRGLTNAVISTSAQAEVATRKHTAAVQSYVNALGAGKSANETEVQYQQRLRNLYVAMAQAKVGMVNATARSDEAVRKSVDGVTKLRQAGDQEVVTAKARLKAALILQTPMNKAAMNAEQAAKADSELAIAQAQVGLAEARRSERLKAVERQQVATRNAIKNSTMTDEEKARSLDIVNREISKTRGALKDLSATPDPKKKIKVDTSTANTTIKALKDSLALLDGKVFHVTIEALKKGFAFGGFAHFAGGGKVRGPGGRDNVPAMLTAGEVVLTKRQQSLVDGGMSIKDAVAKTGGAFANGGYAAGLKPRGKNESAEAFKSRKAAYIQKKKDEAKQRRSTAVGRFAQNIASVQGRAISEKYQGGTTGIGSIETLRRAQEKNIAGMESKFKGTIGDIGAGIGSFAGSFRGFDKFQTDSNRLWERSWTGTIKMLDGSTFSGGFKDFNKKAETGLKALNAQYDALTASEAALKAMDDAQSQADLSGNLNDAMSALQQAQQWGDPKEVAAAQKALAAAQGDQRRASLTQSAAQERAAAEAARGEALTAYEEQTAAELQLLQDSFDDQKAARDLAFSDARTALQGQLDTELQLQRDKDSQALAQLDLQQGLEQAALDRRVAAFTEHYDNLGVMQKDAMDAQIAQLNGNSMAMENSGTTLAISFAKGMVKGRPRITAALRAIGKDVSDYLKLNSPAKKGPLSTLDHWFDALAPTLTSGIDTGSIESSLGGMNMGSGSGGGVSINLTVNDSTFAGMSREQVDRVAREVQAAINRRVSFSI